jgi:TetR/AcrR family transcriptional regulator
MYYISKYLLIIRCDMVGMRQTKERLSGEQRRRQIIDAALKLFSDKGFSGTKTREIAERAGISETLIFQHFTTKGDLYRAALRELFAHHPVVPEIEEKAEKKDDRGVFFELAHHMITHAQQDPRIIRLSAFAALEGSDFADILHRGQDSTVQISELLASYIEQRIKDGVFKKVNAAIVARLFIETVFMHIVDQEVALTGPPLSFNVEETVEQLVNVFLDGMKA